MNYDTIVANIKSGVKVLDLVTWPKIGKAILIATVVVTGWTIWENRQPIYKGIVSYNPQRLMIQAPVSEGTQKAVQELLEKPSNIVAVQLVSVDFRTNTRQTELFKSTIPAMQRIMDEYIKNKIVNTPFFTDDIENNKRNTSLINGEFICTEVVKTAVFSRIPSVSSYATTVCSVSVPPYPGYFSGYINIYLSDSPNTNDLTDVRAAIRKLSLVTFDAEFPK